MPVCRLCKKSGLFLKLDNLGMCERCSRMAAEGLQLRRRKMIEYDIPVAKAYLREKLSEIVYEFDDQSEGRRVVNDASFDTRNVAENGLSDEAYRTIRLFLSSNEKGKDNVMAQLRINGLEEYARGVASLYYMVEAFEAKYKGDSSLI